MWLTKACDLRPDFVLGGLSELFSPFFLCVAFCSIILKCLVSG